jgi:ribose transport system ATP-binding protein
MSADARHSALGPRTRTVVSTAQRPALEARRLRLGGIGAPIDFKLYPGEIVGLAGLDGAGQAEFLRMLAGIDPAPEGAVRIWDKSTECRSITCLAEAEAAAITYVSGDRKKEGIFPNLSIFENFAMALYGRQSGRGGMIDTGALHARFAQEEKRLSIKYGARKDRITTLSGGNQQKVLIARAFAQNPRVILLNDPARGVDIGTKQDLYTHLRAFASNGGAVVYLSTEIEEFFGFADRAEVFFEGSLFASFTQGGITQDNLLAAMFGKSQPIEFDETTRVERAV